LCVLAVPKVTVIPNITDIRQLDYNGGTAQSTCLGDGERVTVRWNTSELSPDIEFDVKCVADQTSCQLNVRGVQSRSTVHCIAANDIGNDVHAWTFYASGFLFKLCKVK